MITEEQLQSAIKAGILNEATANALKTHKPYTQQLDNIVDEEYFRLVSGFNDIFVVIACVLLFISLAWIGGDNIVSSLLIAIAAWGLAEFFVLKRRMALPAIVLLLSFAGAIFAFIVGLQDTTDSTVSFLQNIITACVATIIATWIHWKRFKVPITVATGTASFVGAIFFIILFITQNKWILMPVASMLGVAVFTFAMYWDAADTKRESRKSDVGFWLHLLAAPLIIHPIFELLGVLNQQTNILQAVIVFGLYMAIAITSLIIDRRALMVSALGYVIYVFSTFLEMENVHGAGFALTAFVIGSALLLLSAFWHKCRIKVLHYVPKSMKRYLPN